MIRDNYNRGIKKEIELMNIIRKFCNFECNKNKDPYDIDLIISLHNGKKILIEVEETSDRFWASNSIKPKFPSKLLTMPIRKVKYFINDFKMLEQKSINSIEEFIKLYSPNTLFKPKSENELRLYIKGSYDLIYFCLISEDTIVKSLNGKLKDQQLVDSRINELKQKNNIWKFYKNIWHNPSVKNMMGQYRDDPVLLILGLIDANNDIIWTKRDYICSILKKIIRLKWGIL